MSIPTMDDIYRILAVFNFMRDGGIYPHNCTEQQVKILDYDVKRIRDRYEELKWKTSFSAAMTTAKAEYMYWIFSGCPISLKEYNMDNKKNDPTATGETKDIEFDYLVENISDKQTYFLSGIMADFLNSHDIYSGKSIEIPFHFIIMMDKFLAQQLLEIITAYVESHYLQRAGGFHEVKEVGDV